VRALNSDNLQPCSCLTFRFVTFSPNQNSSEPFPIFTFFTHCSPEPATVFPSACMYCQNLTVPTTVSADAGKVAPAQRLMASAVVVSNFGMDDDTLNNTLYQASVIGNYPWTKQFLLRQRGGGPFPWSSP
jgi:hypothetical protein